MPSPLVQRAAQKKLNRKAERAKRDLRYLAVDILGYDWMSGPWHSPIFGWIDKNRDHQRVALFSPRYSYKSRIECAEVIQEILRNPAVSIVIIHHKLELVLELITEISEHLLRNDELRSLLPDINRPSRAGKFLTTKDGGKFTLPGTDRAKPTVKGMSADQDVTGAHPDILFLDDVISAKTIDHFGGVAGIRNWIEHTVIPLAGVSGKLRVKGTFWSNDDWYHDILTSSIWTCQRRAILETEDQPDSNGTPIQIYVGDRNVEGGKRLLTMDDVQRYKEEMKSHFSGQMMNDPTPEGSIPWNPVRCEHYVSTTDIRKYVKKFVVLTDPAPLGMDVGGKLVQADGKKNYWSIAVIAYLKTRDRTIRVLMDGDSSQTWGLDDGLKRIKQLMSRWRANIVGIEEPLAHGGIGFYARALKEKFGKSEQLVKGKCRTVKFVSTQKGKAPRIMDLCAMAGMTDEKGDPLPQFAICKETCDEKFLENFLMEARGWAGKNTTKFDDHLDAVAYCDDPALMEVVRLGVSPIHDWFGELTGESQIIAPQPRMSRYCGV